MHRPQILIVVGAVLVLTATVLGLTLFRWNGFFELDQPEFTIWLFVVGPLTVAFMGLLYVEMREPSVMRGTGARAFLFGLLGAICGLVVGVVSGFVGIREVCVVGGIDSECGWSVLGMMVRSFWSTFGLLAAIGAMLGAAFGVAAALLTRRSETPITASPVA